MRADAHSGGYTHEGVRVEDFSIFKKLGDFVCILCFSVFRRTVDITRAKSEEHGMSRCLPVP